MAAPKESGFTLCHPLKISENQKILYLDALQRHNKEYVEAVKNNDPVGMIDLHSGKSHMAHIIANALFILWHENQGRKNGR